MGFRPMRHNITSRYSVTNPVDTRSGQAHHALGADSTLHVADTAPESWRLFYARLRRECGEIRPFGARIIPPVHVPAISSRHQGRSLDTA